VEAREGDRLYAEVGAVRERFASELD